jgi:hypothetical protein
MYNKLNNFFHSLKLKGPYLARVEFLHRVLKTTPDKPQQLEDQLKQNFTDYIEAFSSKPGFFYELTHFSDLFTTSPALATHVLATLHTLYTSAKDSLPHGIKSIFTCLSFYQTHRYMGKQAALSLQEKLDLAAELDTMYKRVISNYGKDLPATTFQYADEFALLAAHVRYDALRFNNHSSLLSIIGNLRTALANSQSNFQIKLLLLNLYGHVGAYEPMQRMYDSMEIKNIQHYSTGNLLLVHNIRLAAIGASQTAQTAMTGFFTANLYDLANFLVNCYKFGSLAKAFEMCEFMESVGRSLTMNLCLVSAVSTVIISHPSDVNTQVLSSADEDELIESELRVAKERLDKHLRELQAISGALKLVPGSSEKWEVSVRELVDHTDKDAIYQWNGVEDRKQTAEQYELVIDEQRRLLVVRFSLAKFLQTLLESSNEGQTADAGKIKEVLGFYRDQLANSAAVVNG